MEIKTILKANPESTVSNQEIDEFLGALEIHFQLLGALFSIAWTLRAVMKIRKKELLERFQKVAWQVNLSTRILGLSMKIVKRHVGTAHLALQMDLYVGVGEYMEDWLEQIHQFYKRFKGRGKMRDKARQADYQCGQEKLQHNNGIARVKTEMYHDTARKSSESQQATLLAEESRRVGRHHRRVMAIQKADDILQTPFKSTLQLVTSYYVENETATNSEDDEDDDEIDGRFNG